MDQRKMGAVLSYIGQAVKILVSIVYTPIMLRLLGQNEFGLYQLVYSVVSYLNLLSLGFGNSYLRFYSRYKAKKDEKSIRKFNGMFLMIFIFIAVVCLLLGLIMLLNIKFIFSTGLTENEYSKASVLMALMVFNLAVTLINTVFNCYITAHEKFVFQKILVLLEAICNPIVSIPLLILGFGSVGMVVVSTIICVCVCCINATFCIKMLNMGFEFRGFDLNILREMSVFTFFIFLSQIIDQVNWNVDKFLLGRIWGTSVVAIYGIGAQINSMYMQFSASLSSMYIPQVNRFVAEKNDNRELTELFIKVGRVQYVVIMAILINFVFLGESFINIWAGVEYQESYRVALFLLVPVTIPLIQNLGIEIQRAKNMHRVRSVVYFFIAVGNVFISVPLIKTFGAVGAASGTAVSLVIGNVIFMNWYYNTRIGINVYKFWKNVLDITPSMIIPVVVGILININVEINTFVKFLLFAMLLTTIYLVSVWLFGLNKEEKQVVYDIKKKFSSNRIIVKH